MLELKKFFTSKLMLLHIASRALEQAGYKSTSLEVNNFLSSNQGCRVDVDTLLERLF